MKRFHVHLSVKDLEQSIRFYSTVFGAAPSVLKPDYAKWMLEEPRLNFAISPGKGPAGLSHLGMQVDSADELAELRARAEDSGSDVKDQPGTSCCYAKSDKHWLRDPQGIAWEAFHTTGAEAAKHCGEAATDAPSCGCEPVAKVKCCG
jgi:catechol 2,3-dioxygenase-like lactoylglutathione lyase family enzyme